MHCYTLVQNSEKFLVPIILACIYIKRHVLYLLSKYYLAENTFPDFASECPAIEIVMQAQTKASFSSTR